MPAPPAAALRRIARELFATALDAVAPPHCAACGALGQVLCAVCSAGLERRGGEAACPRCGAAVSAAGARCTAKHDRIAGFAWARAPWRYRGVGGDVVRRFKFDAEPGALRLMVRVAADVVAPELGGAWRRAVFVAVPMHARKRRGRRHDHAARLTEEVARRVGREFVPGALRRLRDTLPQGDPRVTNRSANVEGAFAVARPRALTGRAVVLVDDVTTSGATARACARALGAAGARRIALLTVAVG